MSVPMRDVLVVHPNASRRAALASALPSHRVVAVESKVDAARRMLDAAPALIIAPPDDARLFLREVDRAAPDAVRVFICSQSDPAGLEELMQSAAEGHVFSILDDTLAGIEAVTATDVQRVAADLFANGTLAATVLGPVDDLLITRQRLDLA